MSKQSTIPTSGTDLNIAGYPSCRQWKEMVRSLNLPSGLGSTIERIKTNLVYFRTNYMIIFMLILILSFSYHPTMIFISLSLLVDVYAVFHPSSRKIVIVLVIISVTWLVLVDELMLLVLGNELVLDNDSAAWNIKWTLLIEAVVVAAHASFRKIDDLPQLDEEPPLSTGLPSARPWKEMLQSLNLPSWGFRNTIERMKMNLSYFQMNYMIILLEILFFGFGFFGWARNPTSLRGQWALFMAFLMSLYSLRNKPLVVFHCLIDDRTIMFVLSIITVILVVLFDTGAWIVTSMVLIEALVVAAHSLVRNTHDLSLVEELPLTTVLSTDSDK